MKKKIGKKIISLLLSFAVTLTVLPLISVEADAAEYTVTTYDELKAKLEVHEDCTIKLGADITASFTENDNSLVVDYSTMKTLDLAGHTLSVTSSSPDDKYLFNVSGTSTSYYNTHFTVTDSSYGGKITYSSSAVTKCVMFYTIGGGNLHIDGGEFECNMTGSNTAVRIAEVTYDACAEINGGTFKSDSAIVGSAVDGRDIVINGGKFYGTGVNLLNFSSVSGALGTSVKINGGEFYHNSDVSGSSLIYSLYYHIEITGGYFEFNSDHLINIRRIINNELPTCGLQFLEYKYTGESESPAIFKSEGGFYFKGAPFFYDFDSTVYTLESLVENVGESYFYKYEIKAPFNSGYIYAPAFSSVTFNGKNIKKGTGIDDKYSDTLRAGDDYPVAFECYDMPEVFQMQGNIGVNKYVSIDGEREKVNSTTLSLGAGEFTVELIMEAVMYNADETETVISTYAYTITFSVIDPTNAIYTQTDFPTNLVAVNATGIGLEAVTYKAGCDCGHTVEYLVYYKSSKTATEYTEVTDVTVDENGVTFTPSNSTVGEYYYYVEASCFEHQTHVSQAYLVQVYTKAFSKPCFNAPSTVYATEGYTARNTSPMKVTVFNSGNENVTFQWCSVKVSGTKPSYTPIKGATTASYLPLGLSVGTYNFACLVAVDETVQETISVKFVVEEDRETVLANFNPRILCGGTDITEGTTLVNPFVMDEKTQRTLVYDLGADLNPESYPNVSGTGNYTPVIGDVSYEWFFISYEPNVQGGSHRFSNKAVDFGYVADNLNSVSLDITISLPYTLQGVTRYDKYTYEWDGYIDNVPVNLIGDEFTDIDFENKIIFTSHLGLDYYNYQDIITFGKWDWTINSEPSYSIQFVGVSSFRYGTGSDLTFYYYENSTARYSTNTLIVKGDLNGDSYCDVLDCAAAAMYSTGKGKASQNEILAAKGTYSTDAISVEDYAQVVNIAMSETV